MRHHIRTTSIISHKYATAMMGVGELLRAVLSFILLSTAYILLCSSSTSILTEGWTYNDNSIFYVVGRGWAEGQIPYRDIWDLKGPVVFGANALGHLITGDIHGVSVVQIVLLTLALQIAYTMARCRFGQKRAMIATLAFLLAMTIYHKSGNGNIATEFVMPAITLSYYLLYMWYSQASSHTISHSPYYALLHGMTVGLCAMNRLSDALTICVGIAIIAGALTKSGLWRNFLSNIGFFIIGLLIVILPFVLYFYLHDALDDFWYGTIGYNLSYANSSISKQFNDYVSLVYNPIGYVCFWLLVVSLVSYFYYNLRGVRYIFYIASSTIYLLFLSKTQSFAQYGLPTLPMLFFIFFELYEWRQLPKPKAVGVIVSILAIGITVGQMIVGTAGSINALRNFSTNSSTDALQEIRAIVGKDEVVLYETHAYIYKLLDKKPVQGYPYFTLQEWEISQGESIRPRIYQQFEEGTAKYILVTRDESYHTAIDHILDQRYEPVLTLRGGVILGSDHVQLYRIKEGM